MKIKILLLVTVLLSGCATTDYKIKVKENNTLKAVNLETASIGIVQMPINKSKVKGNGNIVLIGAYNRKMASIVEEISKELKVRGISSSVLQGTSEESWRKTSTRFKKDYSVILVTQFLNAHVSTSQYSSSAHMTMNVLVFETDKRELILSFEVTDPMQLFHPNKGTAIAIIDELTSKSVLKERVSDTQ